MSQEFIDAQVGVFAAAAKGQTDELRSLVEKDPALINAYSPEGFTPLGLAAFFGHAEAVDALLAAGADANLASRESMKMPPLGSAMAVERNDIARTLIEHGANVNGKAVNDLTALHTAAARGNLEAAKLLLDHGADINSTSTDGKTPMSYAEEHNHPEMVEFLKSWQSS
jgi:ankyrin repeat protein